MATSGPHTISFTVRGPIVRADLPGLCDRVCALLARSSADVVLCDVRSVHPDAVTVDALARLQLAALQHGCQVRLRGASEALVQLVRFMALTDVLPCSTTDEFSPVEPSGEQTTTHEGGDMPNNGTRMMFVNVAVEDLERSVEFFTKLGFTFDQRFTDESGTAMIVNGQAFVMLLAASRFADFTEKELADPTKQTEAILALSADSREDVDALADTALDAGGTPANEPMEMGFMYGRSFNDPDGHLWEVFWMDPSALERGPVEAAAGS